MSLNTIETPETAVGNLGFALGILTAGGMSTEQVECFVESVCVLADKAGVRKSLSVFDLPELQAIVKKTLKDSYLTAEGDKAHMPWDV